MSTLREAAQQALDALIHMCHNTVAEKGYDGQRVQNAIDGLEAALAQEEQDTAVHMTHCNQGEWVGVCKYGEEDCPALAQQEQEPVAWMDEFGNAFPLGAVKGAGSWRDDHQRNWTPLFTHPPRREWQSLTEEEIRELTFHNQRTLWPRPDRSDVRATAIPFARAIEQALKERNT